MKCHALLLSANLEGLVKIVRKLNRGLHSVILVCLSVAGQRTNPFASEIGNHAFMTFSNAVLNFSISSREPTVTRTRVGQTGQTRPM